MESDVPQGDRGNNHGQNNSFVPPPLPTTEPPQHQTQTALPSITMDISEPEKKKKTFKEMDLMEKGRFISANITVEPLVVCYMVPSILSSITTLNLNLEKACRVNLNYSDAICTGVANRESEEYANETLAASNLVAQMNTWMTPLQAAGPAILVLFAGSWSDRRHRRKPLALSPIIGELVSVAGLLLCAIFTQWPLEVAGVIEAVPSAISGGLPFMFIACYSYIGEVTSEENRTFRMGMFALVVTAAAPAATACSGYMHESLGYLGVFSLVTVLYILAVLYAIHQFKEPTPPVPRPEGLSFFADFFDWHHVKNTVSVALRGGPGHRRLRVILLVILYITLEGPLYGENANVFLFTLNKLHWTNNEFAFYSTYDIVVGLVGNALVTLLFIRTLKLRDCFVGIIGVICRIIAVPIFAFSSATWHIYAARGISCLSAACIISMRSLATKMVSPDELGQLMGFLGIVEAIIPVVFSPLYIAVFTATSETFIGAYFLLTAGVVSIALIAFLAIEKLQRGAVAEAKKGEEKNGTSLGLTNLAFNGGTEKSQNTYL